MPQRKTIGHRAIRGGAKGGADQGSGRTIGDGSESRAHTRPAQGGWVTPHEAARGHGIQAKEGVNAARIARARISS